MRLHCFVCASPLFPNDAPSDERLHTYYAQAQISSIQGQDLELTFIQNGCQFPTFGHMYIRHPFPKNLAYNWLVCDYNCRGDYWVFLPEDCAISPQGWNEIRKREGRECFSLSKDPKVLIAQAGIFGNLSQEVQVLCEMNFLGKEIGCAVLRGELDKRRLHSISPNWRRLNEHPPRWGNELYEGINHSDHPWDPNINRKLPLLQDYGLDGFNAKPSAIEAAFMKIIDTQFALLREQSEKAKGIISKYGPILTDLHYQA